MNGSNSLYQLAFKKFKKNKSGIFSLFYIFLCGCIAVFCYTFAPDNSTAANQMHLEIHSKPPGFSVDILQIPTTKKKTQSWLSIMYSGKQNTFTELPIKSYTIKDNKLSVISYEDGLIKDFDLKTFNQKATNFITKKHFYLGTDKYGRDLLSRILVGWWKNRCFHYVDYQYNVVYTYTTFSNCHYFNFR